MNNELYLRDSLIENVSYLTKKEKQKKKRETDPWKDSV